MAIILEAVDILLLVGYLVLSIVCAVEYHVSGYHLTRNIMTALLIYVFLTVLAMYPERVNGLSQEACQGKVRKLSLWMIRMEKLIFMASLLVPSICDLIGFSLPELYNVCMIFAMIINVCVFEICIILRLRK